MNPSFRRCCARALGVYLSVAISSLGFVDVAVAQTTDISLDTTLSNLSSQAGFTQSELDNFVASRHGDLNGDGVVDGDDAQIGEMLQPYVKNNQSQQNTWNNSSSSSSSSSGNGSSGNGANGGGSNSSSSSGQGGGGGGGQALQAILPAIMMGMALAKKLADKNKNSKAEGSSNNPARYEANNDGGGGSCPSSG